MKKDKLIIFFIIVFALVTRLSYLHIRPLHHDEGVNFFFAEQIIQQGKFMYDPTNYHGPLYFFSIFLSFILFGVSEFSLRLPSAAYGILLALIPLFLIKKKEILEPYVTLIFLLISPSILYFSRYSIHEIALVFFSCLAIIFFTKIFENKDLRYLPFFSIAIALMLATKETSVILLLLFAILLSLEIKNLKKIHWREQRFFIYISIILFALIYIALFTAFFNNMQGLIQSIRGIFPWLKRGYSDSGHFKPWFYYIGILARYELPIFIYAIFGIFYAWKNAFSKNMAIWFLWNLAIYSIIKYKMPWLVVNITMPMCYLAGVGYKYIPLKKIQKLVITFAGVAYLIFFSFYTNVWYPWQSNNTFAYVHTYANIFELVKKINSAYSPRDKILIVSNEYWPLPFYLYKKNIEYLSDATSFKYEDYENFTIFIVRDTIFSEEQIPKGFAYEQFALRDGVHLYVVYKNQ